MYSFRLLVGAMLCSLLSGCSFYNFEAIKSQPQRGVSKGSQTTPFKRWDEKFKTAHTQKSIQLLAHQKYPIFYLENHPEQPGLVLDHEPGTGKSFTAIEFAERHADRPVIILAPKFLHGHWLQQLNQYQVKDQTRYRFVSHDNCASLLDQKVSNAILIVDESHRFIEKVRFGLEESNIYSQLYLHLRKSHKILSLSATPIYTDIFDLAYQVNLVAGKDILPFNQEEFQKQCLNIDPLRSYWRGHLITSNIFIHQIFPPVFGTFLGSWVGYNIPGNYSGIGEQVGRFLGMCLGGSIPSIAERLIPIREYHLKKLKVENFGEIINCYFSHYSFEHNRSDYPKACLLLKALPYNTEQLNFIYKFYDSRLNTKQLQQLVKDSVHVSNPSSALYKAQLGLNSTKIQNAYKKQLGAGREIGNLPFANHLSKKPKDLHNIRNKISTSHQAQMLYPDKFEAILETIKKSNGPVVLYSHYYYNGLLLFKQFLDIKGYQGKYALFHPDMPVEQHQEIVEQFNANKLKILLLHPEITEGISLKGAQQLHFLEMPINKSLEHQIVGRVIRYRSHSHLPVHEQKVHIYLWYYNIPKLMGSLMARRNWHEQFAELNYYSVLGDIKTIDENFDLKQSSPDIRAYQQLTELNKRMTLFRNYLKQLSIENTTHA